MTPMISSCLLTITIAFSTITPSVSWIHHPQPNTVLQRTHKHQCSTSTQLSMSKQKGGGGRSQRQTDAFLAEIESNPGLKVDPNSVVPDESLETFVRSIAEAADLRKAEDIKAYRVSKITALTEYVVIVSGNSRPQNQAIAGAIKDVCQDDYERIMKGNGVPEGDADSGWILLDYGDVMVHVMTPRSRLYYDIEGQWKDAEEMDLSDVLVPNKIVLEAEIGGSMGGLDEEEDPFWS